MTGSAKQVNKAWYTRDMDIRLKIIIAISIVSLILLGITWSITGKLGQSDVYTDIELAS